MNNSKIAACLIGAFILMQILVPTSLSIDDFPWWDNNWSYRVEIKIPVDTSDKNTCFQPIDVHVEFDETCWALDEKEHSIRVVVQHGDVFTELESQIYDLHHVDEEHIDSCSLVFLIPEDVKGDEKYYVYYDDSAKPTPDYPDHVKVEESYYRYEPLQGVFFESWYYKILQDGEIVYAVAQKGSAMGIPTSQQVMKLKKGVKTVLPNSADQLISFSCIYWWLKNGVWDGFSTDEKLLSKEVFVDGNLMVYFGVKSGSSNGLIQSTVYYKYYYTPTVDKKIYAHVKHQINKYPLPGGEEIDVAFATVNMGKFKSSVLKELNFGSIPSYLHFYNENGLVTTYKIDQNPESSDWEQMISKQDDYDIGDNAWLSVDEGETGKAQGIIFDSKNIVKSGEDERNGIELQFYEAHSINLPGLDGRIGYLYLMRNDYEQEEPLDAVLPKNYTVEFNAEFFTSENGGYKKVEKEADIYQKLIRYQPENNEEINETNEEEKEYNLDVYVHLSKSLSLKTVGSLLFLKYPSIVVKLFKNNEQVGYCRATRVPLNSNYTVDWKNISLFRKARFTHLQEGYYLVKVFLEKSSSPEKDEFIGYQIVDLKKDTDTHVFCKPEGEIRLQFLNQNNRGVKNVQTYITKDNIILSEATSDNNGEVKIGVPYSSGEKYLIKSIYKGFLVFKEETRINCVHSVFPLKKIVTFDVHDLTINVKNSNDKPIDLDITLTSNEMQEPVVLKPDENVNMKYKFWSLPGGNYTLTFKYNSIEVEEKINIPMVNSKTINFYDLTLYVKDELGFKPGVKLDVYLIDETSKKPVIISGNCVSNGEYQFFNLHTGKYILRIQYKSYTVEKQVDIPVGTNENTNIVEIMFPALFNLTTIVFDSHGNPLRDAKIVISRDGKKTQGNTNERGLKMFSIPPGEYRLQVFLDDDLICSRNISILADKTYKIATAYEPLLLHTGVILTSMVLLIGIAYLSYKKRNTLFFFKILAIYLVFIAIVSPWWAVDGLSNGASTHTKMFLLPTNMVTITSMDNISAGEIIVLDETFESTMNQLPIILIAALTCIFISMFLKKFEKTKTSTLLFLISVFLLSTVLIVFTYGMSEFTKVTVGGFIGESNLDIAIPGENMYRTIQCTWGPSIGFYLILFSTIFLWFFMVIDIKKNIYGKKFIELLQIFLHR